MPWEVKKNQRSHVVFPGNRESGGKRKGNQTNRAGGKPPYFRPAIQGEKGLMKKGGPNPQRAHKDASQVLKRPSRKKSSKSGRGKFALMSEPAEDAEKGEKNREREPARKKVRGGRIDKGQRNRGSEETAKEKSKVTGGCAERENLQPGAMELKRRGTGVEGGASGGGGAQIKAEIDWSLQGAYRKKCRTCPEKKKPKKLRWPGYSCGLPKVAASDIKAIAQNSETMWSSD